MDARPVQVHLDPLPDALDRDAVGFPLADLFRERHGLGDGPDAVLPDVGPQGVRTRLELGRIQSAVGALDLVHHTVALSLRAHDPSGDPLALAGQHHLELEAVIPVSLAIEEAHISAGDAKPAGRFYVAWNTGYYAAGEYVKLLPDREVVFIWSGRDDPAPTRVNINLKALDNGATTLSLEQIGLEKSL